MNIHALISRSESKEERRRAKKLSARAKKHEHGDANGRRYEFYGGTWLDRESVLHRSVFSFVNAACADAKLPGQ